MLQDTDKVYLTDRQLTTNSGGGVRPVRTGVDDDMHDLTVGELRQNPRTLAPMRDLIDNETEFLASINEHAEDMVYLSNRQLTTNSGGDAKPVRTGTDSSGMHDLTVGELRQNPRTLAPMRDLIDNETEFLASIGAPQLDGKGQGGTQNVIPAARTEAILTKTIR